jgi:hypothetical protein
MRQEQKGQKEEHGKGVKAAHPRFGRTLCTASALEAPTPACRHRCRVGCPPARAPLPDVSATWARQRPQPGARGRPGGCRRLAVQPGAQLPQPGAQLPPAHSPAAGQLSAVYETLWPSPGAPTRGCGCLAGESCPGRPRQRDSAEPHDQQGLARCCWAYLGCLPIPALHMPRLRRHTRLSCAHTPVFAGPPSRIAARHLNPISFALFVAAAPCLLQCLT